MEKERVNLYLELLDEFENRCFEICKMLTKLTPEYKYINTFWIDENEVCGHGKETWGYGGFEEHFLEFPISYLTMNNKDLQNLIDKKVKEKEEQKRKDEEKFEQQRLQKERKEYERLKAKFG